MKQENRHRNDNDLKKALEGFSKEPSDKVWGNIQKGIKTKPASKTGSKKWYNKGGFFLSSAVTIIGVSALIIGLNKEVKENINTEEPNTKKISKIIVKNGETTLYIFPETYRDALLKFNEILNNHQADLSELIDIKEEEFEHKKRLLIRNGSFESHEPIPHRNDGKVATEPWVKFSKIPYWNAGGIPDYYNSQNNATYMWNNTPESAHGFALPHDGAAYVGLVAHSESDYREYRYTQLAYPLEKGKIYQIEFFIAKGKKGPPISDFGAYFMDTLIDYSKYKKGDMPIKRSNYVTLKNQFYYSGDFYKGGWRKIILTYTAKGNEKYVYLGSMLPIEEVKLGLEPKRSEAQKEKSFKHNSRRRMDEIYSYYFLDNVFMAPIEEFDKDENIVSYKK